MQVISDLARERLCKDFFPNCTLCNCFKTCFPDNKTQDISSKPHFEHELLMRKLDKFSTLDDVQKVEIIETLTALLEKQSLKSLID